MEKISNGMRKESQARIAAMFSPCHHADPWEIHIKSYQFTNLMANHLIKSSYNKMVNYDHPDQIISNQITTYCWFSRGSPISQVRLLKSVDFWRSAFASCEKCHGSLGGIKWLVNGWLMTWWMVVNGWVMFGLMVGSWLVNDELNVVHG